MITITTTATEKLTAIMDQKGLAQTHGLRVFVQGGGCGGMQYGMTFDDNAREDDEVYEQNGLKVMVDPVSLFYIDGSNIDYIDNLMGGGFHIDNPQAVGGCGCGNSFRTARTHTGEEVPEGSCGH